MVAFTFVHAADLHLDAPFRGITQTCAQSSNTGEQHLRTLSSAGFQALEHLVQVCMHVQADFLLLAGDIYNSIDGSLRAHLALHTAFTTLQQHGIQVFLAHGNHDPLGATPLPWPSNVTVFGADIQAIPVMRHKEPLALIHGISHTTATENRNLAAMFQRKASSPLLPDLFQIGLLHCAVQGTHGEHGLYAPCTLADLQRANLDYWALGHVHSHQLWYNASSQHKTPYAAYSGSTQGLHINETGLHGCLAVQVQHKKIQSTQLVPLAPVVWQQCTVDLSSLEAADSANTIFDIEQLCIAALEELQHNVQEQLETARHQTGLAFAPELLPVRLFLTGRSSLYTDIAKAQALHDLQEHLNNRSVHQQVWVYDIVSQVQPLLDMDEIAQRQDLAGEICRLGTCLQQDPVQLTAEFAVLEELLQNKIKRLHQDILTTDSSTQHDIVREAQQLCLQLLEID